MYGHLLQRATSVFTYVRVCVCVFSLFQNLSFFLSIFPSLSPSVARSALEACSNNVERTVELILKRQQSSEEQQHDEQLKHTNKRTTNTEDGRSTDTKQDGKAEHMDDDIQEIQQSGNGLSETITVLSSNTLKLPQPSPTRQTATNKKKTTTAKIKNSPSKNKKKGKQDGFCHSIFLQYRFNLML